MTIEQDADLGARFIQPALEKFTRKDGSYYPYLGEHALGCVLYDLMAWAHRAEIDFDFVLADTRDDYAATRAVDIEDGGIPG